MSKTLALGAKTQWGRVVAVGFISGERYYWMSRKGVIAMIPATTVHNASHPCTIMHKCATRGVVKSRV